MDGSARIAPHGITAATNIGSRSRIAMTAISPTASATVSSLRIIFVVSVFGRARAPAALAQGPGARLYVALAALPVLLFSCQLFARPRRSRHSCGSGGGSGGRPGAPGGKSGCQSRRRLHGAPGWSALFVEHGHHRLVRVPPPGDSIFQPAARHRRSVSGIVRNNFVKQSDTRSPTAENTQTAMKSGSFAKRRILVRICSLSSWPCHCSGVATLPCLNIVKTFCLDRRATALLICRDEGGISNSIA